MTDPVQKGLLVSGAILAALTLVYLAYSQPWYFTSPTYLGALLGLEFLLVAIWMYRRVFFLIVVLTFLSAGLNLPIGGTRVRWPVLAIGAFFGLLIALKDGCLRFRLFHVIALLFVLATFISATVSRYPTVALLKCLSMLLLFVYAGTGARIAANGREGRFVLGLLTGCEIFVGANVLFYAVGVEAMGNPNSLGAVMGAVSGPLLLWGVLLGGRPSVQWRRLILCTLCMYLAFISGSRAGIVTFFVSSALLLLALRKYKLLIEGTVVVAIVVSAVFLYQPNAVPSLAYSVIYKNGTGGVFTSRLSPWQTAADNISNHFWFGMGLGTTANGNEPAGEQGLFSSSSLVSSENGSSYLALLSGVGILGALPFFVMLIVLLVKIVRTLSWTWTSRSASHPAIPLAILIIAGLLHAAFEDWMFAVGNYLCVFYWSIVFIFADIAPEASVSIRVPSGAAARATRRRSGEALNPFC
jgi:O-antigen ligase